MADVVGALLLREETERDGDEVTDLVECTGSGGAQKRFEFGEGLLNGIEVGAVGRQEPQEGPGLLDGRPHVGLLVGREVVEDDDIAGSERRHQDLLDVGAEGVVVDGPIKDGGGGQRGGPERRHHGMRLPVTAGRMVGNPHAAETARVATDQIRGDAGFIDEHILARIVERLGLDPPAAGRGDVRPALFVGVYGFF